MGLALDVGVALMADEAALLIDLQIDLEDVYWDGRGASSVWIGLVIIATGAIGTAKGPARKPSGYPDDPITAARPAQTLAGRSAVTTRAAAQDLKASLTFSPASLRLPFACSV